MTAEKLATLVDQLGAPQETAEYTSAAAPETNYTAWWNPVFDRTMADCVYGNPKGSITFQTLNRLEANIEYLQCMFSAHWQWYSQGVKPKSAAWDRTQYFKIAELNRIKQAIINLRVSGVIDLATPMLTTGAANDLQHFTTFNDMERIMYDIHNAFQRLLDDRLYCGETFAGGTVDDQHYMEA